VRDATRRLDGELERLGDLVTPAFEHLGRGESIERVVDLHGGETRRVVAKHVLGGEILGVERPLPFLVAVAAGANEQVHDAISLGVVGFFTCLCEQFNALNRSLLDFGRLHYKFSRFGRTLRPGEECFGSSHVT
jgi:hypothetical protein